MKKVCSTLALSALLASASPGWAADAVAQAAAKEAGAVVTHVICTIDRQEGARANVEAAGVSFDALFTVADLGITPDPASAGR